MNLALWLERTAQRHPNREALFLGRACVATYGAFYQQALRFAGWMVGTGVQAGDRVAIFAKNCPEYLTALYGIWAAGAVAVPINAKLHPREAAWIMEDSGAVLAFVSKGGASELAKTGCGLQVVEFGGDMWPDVMCAPTVQITARAGDDLAWLFYTSGTTGRPKGVQITHQMLRTMALCYFSDVDQVMPEDAALYAAPMSHGAGLYNLMHVQMCARHVCPPSGGFDAGEVFDLARHFGATHMFAAPTMVKRMTQLAQARGEDGTGLRTVVYAGGPMYLADIIEAEAHFGPVFVQIYGQGECPMGITALSRADVSDRSNPRWRARLASVGRAQSAVEVRIGDASGAALPAGQTGEIMVRGDTVMPGYWRNPEATSKTLVDGWLLTGDIGTMDDEGYVTLQDRSKDVIISGGTNIYPREVEEALLTHPEVQEVSVIGRPDPEWGEDVVAFVVMKEGVSLDPSTLDAHCLRQIARFKRPKAYFALSDLPKNNYGKVLKTELRHRLEEM